MKPAAVLWMAYLSITAGYSIGEILSNGCHLLRNLRDPSLSMPWRDLMRRLVTLWTVVGILLRVEYQYNLPWFYVWAPELLCCFEGWARVSIVAARLLVVSRKTYYEELYRWLMVALGQEGWEKKSVLG